MFVVASTFFVPLVLLSDDGGLARQGLLALAMLSFLAIFIRRSPVPSRQILIAIIIATIGEVVLSLGWGLYSYRHFLIPLYVPAGHGLFYALAAETSHQPALLRRESWITYFVLLSGTLVACFTLAFRDDLWGFGLWLLAGMLLIRAHNRLMISACILYTILLEWAGTAIGNWQWMSTVPLVGLSSANPPSGVGIFYVILDLLVVLIAGSVVRSGPSHPVQPELLQRLVILQLPQRHGDIALQVLPAEMQADDVAGL